MHKLTYNFVIEENIIKLGAICNPHSLVDSCITLLHVTREVTLYTLSNKINMHRIIFHLFLFILMQTKSQVYILTLLSEGDMPT